jgi:hypothetical protein
MDFEDDIRREGRFVTAPDGTPAAIDDRKGLSIRFTCVVGPLQAA